MTAARILRLLGVVAFLILSACAEPIGTDRHPFHGRWSGSFVFTPAAGTGFAPQDGELTLSIAEDGGFTGQIRLASGGSTTRLDGQVDPDGELTGRMEQFTLNGSLAMAVPDRLQGSAAQLLNGSNVALITVDLTRE